jgi:uncharacterized protein
VPESKNTADPMVCFCNQVPESQIRDAIQSKGLKTLVEIYDQTGAGVGPCGGSCRERLISLLAPHRTPNPEAPLLSPEFVHALSLFNRRYYWETHEVLEEVWLEETGPLKLFIQALIQASAAFYHVLNGNPTGVIKLSEAALQKFASYPENYHGISFSKVLSALKDYQAQAKEILGRSRPGFDYTRLPYLIHGKSMDVPNPDNEG